MSLYNELGIAMDASQETIKQKYCNKMQFYRSIKDDKSVYTINMAYKILKSKDKRSIYNLFGDQMIECLTGSKYQYGFLKIIDPVNLFTVFFIVLTIFLMHISSILLDKALLQHSLHILTVLQGIIMTALMVIVYFAISKISSKLSILKKIKYFFLILLSDAICLTSIIYWNKKVSFLYILPLTMIINLIWISSIILIYSANEGNVIHPAPLRIILGIKAILYLSLFWESYILTSILIFLKFFLILFASLRQKPKFCLNLSLKVTAMFLIKSIVKTWIDNWIINSIICTGELCIFALALVDVKRRYLSFQIGEFEMIEYHAVELV